jgi:superfamily I DNA and/or RNA helicase
MNTLLTYAISKFFKKIQSITNELKSIFMKVKNVAFLNQCQKNLIDISARNNLVNFKFSSPTCFDIEKFLPTKKEGKRQAQSFEIEPITKFKEEEDLSEQEKLQKQAHKTLGKIYLKQQEIRDEKGFNPTSWAYYFFKYKDGEKERLAPVYLITTEIVKNGKGGYSVGHFASGTLEANFNHAIYEKFKSELNINIEKTLTSFGDKEVSIGDIDQKISEINDFLAGNIHKVSIEKKIVIGVFNSAKASLYNELVDLEDEFSNHNLIKIFTSKENNELNQGELCEDAREIDKIPSNIFFSPFDFDSSQLQAIKAAKDGKNFIIQGPPGTGKTQTISNIISELVAEGKKVLFVAEKKVAIDAVLKNFSKVGLEKIFLDLHDKKSKSKDIVAQVIDSIDFFRYENYSRHNAEAHLETLDQNKKDISKRSQMLHRELSFGKKPFDLIFELSQMEDIEKIDCDFFTQSSKEDFDLCLKVLEEIRGLSDIYLDTENPFLNKDLRGLKSFLENDKEQKSLSRLKSLIIDTKSNDSELQNVKKRVAELIDATGKFGLNIQNLKNDDELKFVLDLFKEALPNKDLMANEDNPWLKIPIKNPDLFDHKEAKEILERLQKLLDSKSIKDEDLKLLKLNIIESKNGLRNFNFVNSDNLLIKNSISFFNKIKEYKNILCQRESDWLHAKFKNKCFENDKFLEDLINKFDLLAKNIDLLSKLDLELNNLNKKSFNLNFYKLLKRFARRGSIGIEIGKAKSSILSLRAWMADHIEFDDKGRMLDDASLVRAGKDFIVQNRDILTFKDLQNKIYEAGFKDFFLDILEKGSDFEYEIRALENLYSKRLSLEDLERTLSALIKEIEVLTKRISDNLFEISSEGRSLRDEIESRLNYIETVFPIISAQNLIQRINLKTQSLEISELWQNVWSIKCDLRFVRSVIDDYFKNKSLLELLSDNLKNNKIEIDSLSDFIFKCFDPEDAIAINLNSLEERVIFYSKHLPKLQDTIRYLELKNNIKELSIEEFWNNILKQNPPREILKTFKKSFYSKAIENLAIKNELISNTNLASRIVDDFKTLDKNLGSINKNRIIRSLKKRSSKSVQDIEFQELKYRQRFPKPRKIISKYRDIIVNSIGCVVCSPLTICQYFEVDKNDSKNPIFDVVIFDEASQIFTWDALSAIFRAKQMIIAGDTEQMPPTNLFASNDNGDFDEESEDDEKAEDYEGLLSYAAVRLKEVNLQWHYRSKFEQLIHPSNQFVYNGRLISFPNANKNEKPIIFHYLPKGIWEKQTNDFEAKYLIKLLKEIYRSGARSVGVIAINQRQQNLIRDLIYCNDDLAFWLDNEDQDGLFVKNLENCQGDERDIIIVCSSYAKNKDGKIDGRMFSQINKDNAYKRLNVMFSRAKEKLHLLSSLKWTDISSDYESKKGMKFFKNYLRFAETGDFGIASQGHTKQDSFDSGFEESVAKSLRILGYEIDSQVGCSGYKIDLAVICPNTKNYILGIECDGEMYHSGKTAKERDRLRQEVLESKGWKIHRIWSYDWIHCKNEELKNLKKTIDYEIQKSNL